MSYYQFRALAPDRAELRIDGVIGGGWFDEDPVTAKSFAKELKAVGNVKALDIRINSPGGSLFDGSAIYSQLQRHPAHKTVTVEGLAASAASVVAMAGDEIVMPVNALMMIHRPNGSAMGTADDLRKIAEALDKAEVGMIAAYTAKTGKPAEELAALLEAETWMTAEEAVALKFADRVDDGSAVITACAATADALTHFRNPPPALVAALASPPVEDSPMSQTFVSPPAPETPAAPPADPPADTAAILARAAEISKVCAAAGFAPLASALITANAELPAVHARIAEAQQIRAACIQAKVPERVDEFLAEGVTVTEARSRLFAVLVAKDTASPTANTPPAPASTATRAQFEAMGPTQRRQFLATGGRVTD